MIIPHYFSHRRSSTSSWTTSWSCSHLGPKFRSRVRFRPHIRDHDYRIRQFSMSGKSYFAHGDVRYFNSSSSMSRTISRTRTRATVIAYSRIYSFSHRNSEDRIFCEREIFKDLTPEHRFWGIEI